MKNTASRYTGTAAHSGRLSKVHTDAAHQNAIQNQCRMSSAGPCQLSRRDATRTASRISGANRWRVPRPPDMVSAEVGDIIQLYVLWSRGPTTALYGPWSPRPVLVEQ